MKQWRLYARNLIPPFKQWAWVDPDDIIRHLRVTAPMGFVWCLPITPETGDSRSALKSPDGWRKVKTDMTQEQLAKGWLT